MTLIVKPFTFTAGTKAKASEVNSDLDTIYTAFNGAVGEANVTFVTASDGLRAWRSGPNAGGTNGQRIALISKSVALGASTSGTSAITFSTDAVLGNPAFSATPTASGIIVISTGLAADTPHHVWLSALTSTTATIAWVRAAGGANTVTFSFYVAGNV